MPVFLVLGLCAGVMFAGPESRWSASRSRSSTSSNSSTLMALPLFVMAAAFMRLGGVAHALVDLATAWVGGFPARSDSSPSSHARCLPRSADRASQPHLRWGRSCSPRCWSADTRASFALGVIGASGTIGIVIPPSLSLILYGIVTEQSVPRLFLAGILPGMLQAAIVRRLGHVLCAPRTNCRASRCCLSANGSGDHGARCRPDLPTIVIAGIYGGMVTVTEAAALSAMIALGVSVLSSIAGSRRARRRPLLRWPVQRVHDHDHRRDGAGVRTLDDRIGRAGARSSSSFSVNHLSTWQFLLTINVLLLIIGCFLEVSSTLLVVMPILAPALLPLGVDPVHFAIIFTHNMEVGLVHPPVGLNLFVLSHRRRANTRSDPRHPAVSYPAGRVGDHHIRARALTVAPRRGVRAMKLMGITGPPFDTS